jgi:hypothetical protein
VGDDLSSEWLRCTNPILCVRGAVSPLTHTTEVGHRSGYPLDIAGCQTAQLPHSFALMLQFPFRFLSFVVQACLAALVIQGLLCYFPTLNYFLTLISSQFRWAYELVSGHFGDILNSRKIINAWAGDHTVDWTSITFLAPLTLGFLFRSIKSLIAKFAVTPIDIFLGSSEVVHIIYPDIKTGRIGELETG